MNCSKHSAHEGVEAKPPPKEKVAALPSSKKHIGGKVTTTPTSKLSEKPSKPDNEGQLILKSNKDLDKLWHEKTKFVFRDGSNAKVTIGKYINNKVIPLTSSDLEMCKKMGIKYEKPKKGEVDIVDMMKKVLIEEKEKEEESRSESDAEEDLSEEEDDDIGEDDE